MKNLLSVIVVFLILVLCETSCKKDKDKSTDKTVTERIQGVWHFDNAIFNDHFNNTDNRDTLVGSTADIVDFRTDGKVYTFVMGEYDTTTYSIPSDTQLIIDAVTFDIKALTDNALSLYTKEIDGSDYSEETDNFKR